jgi:hypothetical protein
MAPAFSVIWPTATWIYSTDYTAGGYLSSSGTFYQDRTSFKSKVKQARLTWLKFTRGNGWSEGSSLIAKVTVPLSRRQALQPGLKQRRRPARQFRWHSLKQLRRLGVI